MLGPSCELAEQNSGAESGLSFAWKKLKKESDGRRKEDKRERTEANKRHGEKQVMKTNEHVGKQIFF